MTQKLLIVDDEPVLIKGLKYSLEQEKYIIDTAIDGAEALNKALENKYDLIVLDLMLPKNRRFRSMQKNKRKINGAYYYANCKGR
uniref:response regulator n=1 Tax=Crassaminicella thermophila TaxID=2599308 RepID=UPI0038CBF9AA